MAPPRTRRPGFSRRAQYSLFLAYVGAVGGALLGAGLLLLSTFNPGAFNIVRNAFAEVTTPISSGIAWMVQSIAGTPRSVSEHFNVRAENERLRRQIAANETLVMRARTLNAENRRLRRMLSLRDVTPDAVAIARLVSSSATSTRRFATLNAGSRQRVEQGMPVREADGLIGQVIAVGLNTSRVLLIVDPESVVPVRRTSDGLPAIASGRGEGRLEVKSASVATVFRPGDTFVTSGTGGIFPPNIPVGSVSRVEGDTAILKLAADPDALDFALVQRIFLEPPPVAAPEEAPAP